MITRRRQLLRQTLRSVMATLMLAALGTAGWFGWRALDAPVQLVTIGGELSVAERERASEIVAGYLPDGVLSLDTDALQQRLEEESWLARASVRRRWPDGVDVDIEPEVPVALWRDGELLSSRGRVVTPLEDIVRTGMVTLSGPEGSSERVMATYQRIADVLRPMGLRIELLELDELAGWRFVVEPGVEVAQLIVDENRRALRQRSRGGLAVARCISAAC